MLALSPSASSTMVSLPKSVDYRARSAGAYVALPMSVWFEYPGEFLALAVTVDELP